MDSLSEVTKLLKKHLYTAVVRRADDGCVLELPHPKLKHPGSPQYTTAYAVKRGQGGCGVYTNSTQNDREIFTPLPEYAVRMFVMGNILNACGSLGLTPEFIEYLGEGGEEVFRIESVIDAPGSADECRRESLLADVYREGVLNGFTDATGDRARGLGVGEGYDVCKAISNQV